LEPQPFPDLILSTIFLVENIQHTTVIASLVGIVVLLTISGLISGSESAFFSLNNEQLAQMQKNSSRKNKLILQLLNNPQQLLTTILIVNNLANIGIIILSTIFFNVLFDFSTTPTFGIVLQVVVVTFIILLFCEILPKVYANKYAQSFASFIIYPIYVLNALLKPASFLFISSTSLIRNKFQKRQSNISLNDLSGALDLTENSINEDKDILKGIVGFSNIIVKEIMRPRIDVFSIDDKNHPPINEITEAIKQSGYSRIPIYDETFDNIKGVLYAKDLLPHLDDANKDWRQLMRSPYYVHETKKINELLKEFQTKKIHLAIVVDEYGGTQGIVTLEDILEEIVGEISDEYDDEELAYKQLSENVFLFEGKILLNDFYKIISIDSGVFDKIKGDADTLAGLILEMKGEIPQKGEKIEYKNFLFRIEAGDNRRIKKIKVVIKQNNITQNQAK